MTPNQTQSKINLLRAQIDQLENSHLFSPAEKESKIIKIKTELDELVLQSPNEIEVNNPETI